MVSSDLERVLCWRNHSDVRRYMYSQHEITLAEHERWFERAARDERRSLLIFESNRKPFGFINIHQIAVGGIAEWGFYVAPNSPKGIGYNLGKTSLEYAFTQLKLHKICGEVLLYNEKSIKFHRKLNFREEGILRDHYFDGQTYHNVVCFGLLVSEWQENY